MGADGGGGVSVIVPFLGDRAEAEAAIEALARLELGPGDEILLVDNTEAGVVDATAAAPIEVVRAPERRSAYYARNGGAAGARGEWLLFLDADCSPPASLIEDYFASAPDERTGVLAGELSGDPAQTALAARWSRSRRGLRTAQERTRGPAPAGVTGNMLVRRAAWDEVGGFPGQVRSDADLELCWRIQAAGWRLEYRPEALVVHRDPERIGALWRQAAGYGAGRRWTERLHPGSGRRPPLLAPLARAAAGAVVWTVTLRFERSAFKLLDGLAAAGLWWGYVAVSNEV
jgi:cellulose synthase/poly-beta-1,6-N-acetylglucosamine synthase-like glycosyltransferase